MAASDRSAIVSTSSSTAAAAAAADDSGMIVFDARLAKELIRRRFPTGYLGVRRLRPSSRAVARVLQLRGADNDPTSTTTTTTTPPVVYKVVDPDTGHERRMTAREKKAFKRDLGAKRKRRPAATAATTTTAAVDGLDLDPPEHNEPATALTTAAAARDDNDDNANSNISNTNNNKYLPWSIDAAKMEEEIADLRGAREGVPPVYLPPPLAALALSMVPGTAITTTTTMKMTMDGAGDSGTRTNSSPDDDDDDADAPSASLSSRPSQWPRPRFRVVVDDEWAQRWATDLKKSMKPAEDVRDKEDMRPMPYHLVPEVWQRLRPTTLGRLPTSAVTTAVRDEDNKETEPTSSSASIAFPHGTSWSFCDLRPAPQRRPDHDEDAAVDDDINDDDMDAATAAIVQVLHAGTGLHIACGAKFGCDYLLYDGPRGERHAFAGVRFLLSADAADAAADGSNHHNTSSSCPPGNAYDLSGYVRCLNTAGKLALLAAARRDKTTTTANDSDDRGGGDSGRGEQVVTYRVAIVDLALVKIVETTFKKPKKTMEQRLQNLAKTNTTQS